MTSLGLQSVQELKHYEEKLVRLKTDYDEALRNAARRRAALLAFSRLGRGVSQAMVVSVS